MQPITLDGDAFVLDAKLLAESLDMSPDAVLAEMRNGQITSICETGADQDAGTFRLTFFHKSRRLRLIVDDACNILQRSVVNFGQLGIPPAARQPVSHTRAVTSSGER